MSRNPAIRDATPEELRRFDQAFFALRDSPGFQGLSVKMSLMYPRHGCEVVDYGGVISSPEAIPVMERLVEKIGKNGLVAVKHVNHEHALLNRQIKELQKAREEKEAQLTAEFLAAHPELVTLHP